MGAPGGCCWSPGESVRFPCGGSPATGWPSQAMRYAGHSPCVRCEPHGVSWDLVLKPCVAVKQRIQSSRIYPHVTGMWSSPRLPLCIVLPCCTAAQTRPAPNVDQTETVGAGGKHRSELALEWGKAGVRLKEREATGECWQLQVQLGLQGDGWCATESHRGVPRGMRFTGREAGG